MAEAILTIAGGAMGGWASGGMAIGMSIGAALGGTIGRAIDSALAPPPPTQYGPRLDDRRVQTSAYGVAIPRVYGRARLAGNVIDAFPLEEVVSSRKIGGGGKMGKGGKAQRVVTYSYRSSFAVAICEGPIAGIEQIFLDRKLVWDVRTGRYDPILDGEGRVLGWEIRGLKAAACRVWFGTPWQPADPTLERYRGAGNVPGYRDTVLLILDGLELEDFGNRMPGAETVFRTESDAWSPQAFPSADLAHSFLGEAEPLELSAQRWATIGVQDGRLAARVWSLNGDRTGAQAGSVIMGPTLPDGTSDVSAAVARDGRRVAVAVRSPGQILAALFDADGERWAGSSAQVVGAGEPLGNHRPMWMSDQAFIVPQSGTACYAWSTARGLRPHTSPVVGLPSATPAGFGLAVGIAIPESATSCIVLMPVNAFMGGFFWVRVSDGPILTVGAAMPLIDYWQAGRMTAHPLTSDGRDWMLCSGTRRTPGSPTTWIGTLRLTPGGAPVMTRTPVSVALSGMGDLQVVPVHLGDGRVAVISTGDGYDAVPDVGVSRVSGWRTTPTGFELAHAPAELPGGPLPLAVSDTASAWAAGGPQGWLLCTPSPAASGPVRLHPVRLWRGADEIEVAEIASRVCLEAGFQPGEFDFSAVTDTTEGLTRTSVTSAGTVIDWLKTYAGMDLVEWGGRVVGVPRSDDAPVEIPDDLLGAYEVTGEGQSGPPAVKVTIAEERSLPRRLEIGFLDRSRDYQENTQDAELPPGPPGSPEGQTRVALPLVMSPDRARAIAEERLHEADAARETYAITVPPDYLWIRPGRLVKAGGFTFRVASATVGMSVVELSGPRAFPLTPGARVETNGGYFTGQDYQPPGASDLAVLDLPVLDPDGGDAEMALRFAVSAGQTRWPGASVELNTSGTFEPLLDAGQRAVLGVTVDALAPGPVGYWDDASTVTVTVPAGLASRLASVSEDRVYEGANLAVIGDELVSFRAVTQLDAQTFRLSSLLRARRGTEAAMATHAAGDRFVLLDEAVRWTDLPLSLRGRTLSARATTLGIDPADSAVVTVVPTGRALMPLPPSHLAGERDGAGSLTVTWSRRARFDFALRDSTGMPLDEPSEIYDVEVLDGATVVRSARVSSPFWSYAAAEQTLDFGTPQPSVTVRVFQVSSRVGRGTPASAVV